MFNNPTTGGGFTEIDPGKYYVKVTRLEPFVGGQFGDQVKWVFEVATLDGVVLTDDHQFNAEFWQWSSPKISTGGRKGPSKAYEWGEALLPGTDLMSLTGEEFGQLVIGKKALALIGTKDSPNGKKSVILSMSPLLTKSANGKAVPAAKAAPIAPPEPPPDDPELIEADAIEAEQADATAAPW